MTLLPTLSLTHRTFCAMLIAGLALAVAPATAQTKATALQELEVATPTALAQTSYRLWKERAPGAHSDSVAETPTITVFRPHSGTANGTAVIIAPGGAYIGLAAILEGSEPASWFTSRGITAFVLTYRVGAAARLPTVLQDGVRAVRFTRAHAAEFGIDPSRIGMMGFSAGGHLAASTAVAAEPGRADAPDPVDRVDARINFLILAYPWLEGTKVGKDGRSQYCDFATMFKIACKPQDYGQFQPTQHVTATTSPTFIYHTASDELVPVGGSVRFFDALIDKGVSAELHAFAKGRHGTGLGGSDPALSQWPILLDHWLQAQGLSGRTVSPAKLNS
jgi:acetyl esterase/lipase